MTTKDSPVRLLITQAHKIVVNLKRHMGQVPGKDFIKFAVVQDDKLLSFEWTWEFIDNTNAQALTDLIVTEMRK